MEKEAFDAMIDNMLACKVLFQEKFEKVKLMDEIDV
jgi:hypothetical protein